MIQKLLVLLIHFGPKTKRWFWRVWYNIFARKAYSHNFFFMNYGFSDENLFIEINPEEKHERYPAQLYHHTANQEDISEKKVIEVSGLEKIREKNITNSIISALKKMSKDRKEKIKKHVPKPIQPVFMSYAGVQGSEIYDSFIQNKLIYKSATFRKLK